MLLLAETAPLEGNAAGDDPDFAAAVLGALEPDCGSALRAAGKGADWDAPGEEVDGCPTFAPPLVEASAFGGSACAMPTPTLVAAPGGFSFSPPGFTALGFPVSAFAASAFVGSVFAASAFVGSVFAAPDFAASDFAASDFAASDFAASAFVGSDFAASAFVSIGFHRIGFCVIGFRRVGFRRAGFRRVGFCRVGFCRVGFCRIGFRRTGFCRVGFRRVGFCRDRFSPRRISSSTGFGYRPRSALALASAAAFAWASALAFESISALAFASASAFALAQLRSARFRCFSAARCPVQAPAHWRLSFAATVAPVAGLLRGFGCSGIAVRPRARLRLA